MAKVFSEQYGCSASLSDNEIMLGLLEKAGFKITDDVNGSDLNLIVTCTVKLPTKQRMIHRIKDDLCKYDALCSGDSPEETLTCIFAFTDTVCTNNSVIKTKIFLFIFIVFKIFLKNRICIIGKNYSLTICT